MTAYYYYGDTLYHHGIKGQKWGLRKYQNEDGSLTPAGREHYGYGSAKGTAYRVASKVYGFNEKVYSKLGNKTLASMNKAAKDNMLKKASNADKTAAEKRAEKEEYKNSDEYKARQAKIKKAAIAGAAVAATALAAYGAYKVSEAIKDKNRIEAGKRAAMNLYNANAPATTYARQSKLDGKVYYKMKNAYGDTIQTGRAKDLDSYRKIVSDRQWEATQQHAKAIRDLQAKKRK